MKIFRSQVNLKENSKYMIVNKRWKHICEACEDEFRIHCCLTRRPNKELLDKSLKKVFPNIHSFIKHNFIVLCNLLSQILHIHCISRGPSSLATANVASTLQPGDRRTEYSLTFEIILNRGLEKECQEVEKSSTMLTFYLTWQALESQRPSPIQQSWNWD